MSTASRKPKRNAMIIVETTTTLTDEITSSRVGQTTLRSSPTQSFPNWTIFDIPVHLLPIVFLRKPEQTHQRQAYREGRPRGHPAKTGQAGLEPATFGFGDRRSTIRATDLGNRESLFQSAPGFPGKLPQGEPSSGKLLDLCFLVQRMLAVKRTILVQFKFSLGIFSVLLGCIVLSFAFRALQRDNFYGSFFSHYSPLIFGKKMIVKELPSGIEPLTSTLPWLRSAD